MPPSSRKSPVAPAAQAADAPSSLPPAWEKAVQAAIRAIADEDDEWTRVVGGVILSPQDGTIHYTFGDLEGELGSDVDEMREAVEGLIENGNFPNPAATPAATPAAALVPVSKAVKMTGNDWIAIAITRASTKDSIVQITSALTSQNLKSYFGHFAAKSHGLWTVDDKTYSLTDSGRKKAADLLQNQDLATKLDDACAGGDDGEDSGGEEDEEDESAVPIPPVGAAVYVMQALPAPGLKKQGIEKLRKALSGEGVRAGESPTEIGVLGGSRPALAFVGKGRKQTKVSLAITVGDDGDKIAIEPCETFDETLASIENAIRAELFEFEERKVAVVQGDMFQTDESPSSGTVYSAAEFGDMWKAGAPVVGAAVQLADEDEESGWASHTVTSVTPVGKTFKVDGGGSKPIKVSEYGDSWRYVPVAKPVAAKPVAVKPAPVKPVAAQPAVGKRSAAAAASYATTAAAAEGSVSSLLARLDAQIASVDAETEEMVEYSKIYNEIERANKDASKERIAFLVAKHVAANPINISASVRERTAPLQTARDELARAAKAAIKALGAPLPAKKAKSK